MMVFYLNVRELIQYSLAMVQVLSERHFENPVHRRLFKYFGDRLN